MHSLDKAFTFFMAQVYLLDSLQKGYTCMNTEPKQPMHQAQGLQKECSHRGLTGRLVIIADIYGILPRSGIICDPGSCKE